MTIKIIGLLAVLLCAPALAPAMAASPEPTGQDSHVVTGMLEELDLSKMSGKIKTDLEQTVAFTIKSPDLFKGLSVGERIAVRLIVVSVGLSSVTPFIPRSMHTH
jgi:hypothetical protein